MIQARVVGTGLAAVDMRRPGTFTITYTVTDTTGYAAVPVSRTVVVRAVLALSCSCVRLHVLQSGSREQRCR